jgi:hypothetical protein
MLRNRLRSKLVENGVMADGVSAGRAGLPHQRLDTSWSMSMDGMSVA